MGGMRGGVDDANFSAASDQGRDLRIGMILDTFPSSSIFLPSCSESLDMPKCFVFVFSYPSDLQAKEQQEKELFDKFGITVSNPSATGEANEDVQARRARDAAPLHRHGCSPLVAKGSFIPA